MLINRNYINSKAPLAKFFLASVVIIYFIFSPAIYIPSYHHDTYKYSYGGIHAQCNELIGYAFNFIIGRPFAAYLDCANFKLANTLENISYLRIVIDLLIGLTMGSFVLWLNSEKFSLLAAFLISGAIFCLPAMNTAIIMGGTYLILPVLIVFAAYLLFDKGFISFTTNKLKASLLILVGFVGLMISFLTYPSMSGFFLVPAFVLTLFRPLSAWSETRKIVVRDVIAFCAGCFVYYILAKYIRMIFHVSSVDLPGAYRMTVNLNILQRWESFIQSYPLLWNINQMIGPWQSRIVYFITGLGFAIGLWRFVNLRNSRNSLFYSLVQVIVALLILLSLGNVVYMLQPVNFMAERILFIFQAMSVFVLVWCLREISYLFRYRNETVMLIPLGIMFVFAAITISYRSTKFALEDSRELFFITSQIAPHINKEKISRIHIIASKLASERRDTTLFTDDTANILHVSLQTIANAGDFSIKSCASHTFDGIAGFNEEIKCIQSATQGSIAATHSFFGEPFYSSPNTLVIDMSSLERLYPKVDRGIS